MIQIGNELNNGMLWPTGKLSGDNAGGFDKFVPLLQKDLEAVDDISSEEDKEIRTVVHLAEGGDSYINGSSMSWIAEMQ